jgi:hypothetical protein
MVADSTGDRVVDERVVEQPYDWPAVDCALLV